MNQDERYECLKSIFDTACDLPRAERGVYLDRACADDAPLRAGVEQLLRAEDDSEAPLRPGDRGAGPGVLAEEMSSAILASPPVPTRIDRYRIVREIGRGGMGSVYEAEQENPRRRVALKVIRSAIATPELIRRFRHEAQLLGRLDHPGIAHVYEAGSALVGSEMLPYLVMELVEGQPLDEHVRAEGLGTAAILELVAAICDAVQHAHQRGVIHRDLKPPNILVRRSTDTSDSERPDTGPAVQPKVLDFGVARATDADIAGTTFRTHAGQVIGTLSYMSPEQVAGKTDIDTRCDVYALGVILYELLSGKRPFDLVGQPMAEAARTIEHDDPTNVGVHSPSLHGDIVTIVGKAMEKDRERRYLSAAALADDIRRYLRSEPISARPTSVLYLLRRFARRNRAVVLGTVATLTALIVGLVASTIATLTALAIGLVASTIGFIVAMRERDAKAEALETSDAVTEFLSGMLTAARPGEEGRNVTVVKVLENVSTEVHEKFADRPSVEAKLRSVIGGTYLALGQYAAAESHLFAAVNLLRQKTTRPNLETTEVLTMLGNVRCHQGEYQKALTTFLEVQEMVFHMDPTNERRALSLAQDVAFVTMQLGRLDEAHVMFEKVSEEARRVYGADSEDSIMIDSNFAILLSRLGDYEPSEHLHLDVIDRSRRVRGADHPSTLLVIASYASILVNNRRDSEAIPLLRETLSAQEKTLGEGHSQTLITLGNLAQALANADKLDDAEVLVQEGLRRSEEAYGPDEPSTFFLRYSLAVIARKSGGFERSHAITEENLGLARRALGTNAHGTYQAWLALLTSLLETKRYEACVESAAEFVAAVEPDMGPGDPRILSARRRAAAALIGLERYEPAEVQLNSIVVAVGSAQKPDVADQMVELYEAWGRPGEVAEWQEIGKM